MNNATLLKYSVLENKDYGISAIRMISFLLIFSCHVFQYLNIELAWWFNVGVQVFLCISGYLYGGKRINGVVKFLSNRYQKILIEYYIVLFSVLVIQFLYCPEKLSGG